MGIPVRKIGLSYTNAIRGMRYSDKVEEGIYYESTLEKDFIYLLEFNLAVEHYETQPVKIEYRDDKNGYRTYTPDFLVTYRDDTAPGKWFKPCLIEIKYRKDLWENWKDLKPKFKAAINYADKKGYKFKIVTENEIRTEYFYNIKFLLRYRKVTPDIGMIETLYDTLEELEISTPNEIIVVASMDKNRRAELLYVLWYMISNSMIACDLHTKITMNSEIWIMENEPKFNRP
jgi:hypothetical protein